MDLGEEDGRSDPFGCYHVGIGVRHAFDQSVEPESAQVIGHLVHAVVVAEESGHQPAKALVGKTGDGMDDTAQGAGQGHGAWIPEAQGSGSLALPVVGLVDALKERSANGTALAGTFDHKHPMVDLPGLVDELGQMTDPSEKPQVNRDLHRFGEAETISCLVLWPRLRVVDFQGVIRKCKATPG